MNYIYFFFLHAVIYLLLFMHYFYGLRIFFFLWAKSHYVGLLWLWLLLLVLLLLFALTKQILWPLSKLVKNCGSLIIVILWLSLS